MSSNQIKRIGRYWNSGGGTPDWATVNANVQRSYVAERNTVDTGKYWWYRGGGRVGRNTAGTKRFRFYAMSTTTGTGSGGAGSRVPNAVLKYTAEGSTSVLFTGSNEGEWQWLNFTEPFLGDIDTGYAFGIAARDAGTSVGMVQAATIPGSHNTWFYDRATDGSGIPQSGYSSTVNAGHQAVVMEGEKNVAPNQPGAVVISGPANSQTPTMTASFSDDNETLANGVAWDRLEQVHYETWWGGVVRDNVTYTASSGERTARQSSHALATPVPFDTPVTYFVYHIDRGGLMSVSRSISFVVYSDASVDEPTTPPAWVANHTAPGNITAVYRSTGGLNCNRFVVQLVNASGNLIKESPGKDVSIAPNGTLSMTWAESTFAVQPGTTYGVKISARDTNGNWSQYSPIHWFTTNAAPTVPVITSPAGGFIGNTRPLIQIDTSDADKAVGTLTMYVRFYNTSDVQQGGNYTATWNAGTGRYELQTTSTHLASLGTIRKVRTSAFDGTLYSGGATAIGSATWSAPITINYVAAPTVTITAPAGPTVSTTTPTITWTCADQTAWRIEGWIGGTLVYNTGNQSGAGASHTVQSSTYWIGGEKWNNGETIGWIVFGQDSTTLWGQSSTRTLTLDYPPIDPLIITGSAMAYPGVNGTHYMRVHNSASGYPGGQFRAYRWSRQFVTGENGTPIAGTLRQFPDQVNSGTLDLYDHDVPSNQWIRYTVVQSVLVGNDIIESPPVSIDLMCAWNGTLIHSNADPLASYVWLKYGPLNGSFEPHMNTVTERRDVRLRGRRAPVAFITGQQTDDPSGDYTFVPTEGVSAMDQLDALYRLADWQRPEASPNGRPNGICWRAGRGGSRGLRYVTLNSIDANPAHTVESVSLEFQEYDFDPFEEDVT